MGTSARSPRHLRAGLLAGLFLLTFVAGLAPQTAQAQSIQLTATAGNGKVDLSWTWTGITGQIRWTYIVSGAATLSGTATAPTATLNGLTNGQIYDIEMRAMRPSGIHIATSNRVRVVPNDLVIVSATGLDSKIRVKWDYQGGQVGSHWEHETFEGTGGGPWRQLRDYSAARSGDIKNLVNGKTYNVRIRYVSGGGGSHANSVKHNIGWVSATPRAPTPTLVSGPDASATVESAGATTPVCYNLLAASQSTPQGLVKYLERREGISAVPAHSLLADPSLGVEITQAPAGIAKGRGVNLNPCVDLGVGAHTVTWSWKGRDGTAAVAATTSTTITVAERAPDPKTITLSAASTTITEGDSGSTDVTVTATLSEAAPANFSIAFTLPAELGTAQPTSHACRSTKPNPANADFCLVGGDISIAEGETQGTQTVRIIGDTRDEPNETIKLLSYETGWVNGTLTLTIADDDEGTTKPAAPTGLSAEAGNGEVVLTWTDPDDDSITGYRVQRRKGSAAWGSWASISGSDADTVTHTVTGLDNDSEYRIRIQAVNGGGNSAPSATVRETPSASPQPARPVLTATAGDASVTLGWSAQTDITSWGYQYKSGAGSWNTTTTVSDGSATSATVTGLTNGTEYTFRLFARRGSGASARSSSWSDEVTATPTPGPAAPVLTAATSTTNGIVDLTWTHAGGSNEIADADDYVRNAARFYWWGVQSRLKGETVWREHTFTQAVPRAEAGSRSNQFGLGTLYPDGASLEVRVRARGYNSANRIVNGPWSNIRTVISNNPRAPALTLTGTPVTVEPGSTATYTVALTKAYAGTLSVTSDDTSAATVHPASLTFTAGNWSTGQTVTVTGVANGTATVNHAFRLTGATADAIPDAGTVDVTVADAPGVTVSTAALRLAEGGSKTYTVRLNTVPSANVTVTVGGVSGDVTVADATLTFTAANWNKPQTVTVNAGTDTDTVADPEVILTHSASGGGYGSVGIASVVVSVAEKDVAPAKPAGLAAAAGDGSVTLSWTDPDNPTVTKWQVRRKAGGGDWGEWEDIADSGAGTTSHMVGGLDNGTAYSFGVRAVNAAGNGAASDAVTATPAVGSVTVTPGALTVDEGGSATYTVVLDTAPTGTVTVTVGGASGDVTVSPERLAFTPAGHAAPQTVTVRAALDADTETDPAVTLTHSASGGGYGSVSVGSVVVTVTETTRVRQARRANRVHAAVLPHVAAATVSQTLGAVTERIAAAASGASGSGPALRLGALPAAAGGRVFPPSGGLPPPSAAARRGPTLAEVLDGASLTLAPGGAAAGASPAVWARGGRVSLSGSEGGVSWDGGLWSAQFGADMRVRPDLLAGLAVSHAESRVDAATSGDGGVRVESVHETTVTSVNPYVAWLSPDGASLWASVGHGRGGVRVAEAGAPPRRAGLTQWSAAAGGRAVLAERPGGGGVTRLAVRGEAALSRLRTGAGGGLAALAVDTARLRVALEGAHERALGDGATLTPAVELGVRYDGGDLGRDFGAEAGASLAWRDPAAGLTAELRARALAAHGRDRDEWGVGALLRLDPGADGRGTFLSLGPSHGRTESGLGRLFDRGPVAAAGTGTAGARQAEGRLEAEVGHGFGLPGPGPLAVLTPWAGLDLAESGARTLRLGARYRVGQALALGMEATHRPGPAAGQTLTLHATLRW